MADADMTSNRPYLIRALYDWIIDNHMTPHILVDATISGVEVPAETIQEDKVVLNVAPAAVQNLDINNEWIVFSARFSGTAFPVSVPIIAVLAVYARENGNGMMFAGEGTEESPEPPPEPPEQPPENPPKSSHLKLVK